MTKKPKDGLLMRELKEWGTAAKIVGKELGEGFRDFGHEVCSGKPPKKRRKKSANTRYMIVLDQGSRKR